MAARRPLLVGPERRGDVEESLLAGGEGRELREVVSEQLQLRPALRRDGERGDPALRDGLALDLHLPRRLEPVGAGAEAVAVLARDHAFLRVGEREGERLLDLLHVPHLRLRRAVGVDHAVADEVDVVREVAEVAAVAPVALVLSQDALLDPVPDEAALQAVVRADRLPVVGEAAAAVAHRVRVLAHDVGAVVLVFLDVADHRVLDGRIHRVHDVREAVRDRRTENAGVLEPAAVHRALVVERARGVGLADPVGEREVVLADAALVAERPEDHGRVVPVAHHHARAALEPRVAPGVVMRERRVVRVGLDVGLVHEVDAVLVAQVEPAGLVRVVAAADGVEVEALEELHVQLVRLRRDELAVHLVELVAVHAADLGRPAVHEELAVFDADVAEADALRDDLERPALEVAQRDDERVEVRHLGAPRRDARQARLDHGLAEVRAPVVGLRAGRKLRAGDGAALRVEELRVERPVVVRVVDLLRVPGVDVGGGGVVGLEPDPERAGGLLCPPVPARADRHVADVERALRVEVGRAVDAELHPVVLVLDVALRAPAHAQHRELVAALADELREVELRRELRIGGHADERAVDVVPRLRLRGADVEDRAALLPALRQDERRAQDRAGVLVRHARRVVPERHLHVRVVRVGEALRAEVAGDVDLRPLRRVGLVRDLGGLDLLDLLVEGDGPLAVKREVPLAALRIARERGGGGGVGDEVRAAAQTVHRGEFGDFPGAGEERRVEHGVTGCWRSKNGPKSTTALLAGARRWG